MATIEWKPVYSVGVEQLDEQHQKLLQMINDLSPENPDEDEIKPFSTTYKNDGKFILVQPVVISKKLIDNIYGSISVETGYFIEDIPLHFVIVVI